VKLHTPSKLISTPGLAHKNISQTEPLAKLDAVRATFQAITWPFAGFQPLVDFPLLHRFRLPSARCALGIKIYSAGHPLLEVLLQTSTRVGIGPPTKSIKPF
jgi:hypothetical protein